MDRKKRLKSIFIQNKVILAYLFGSQAEAGLEIIKGKTITTGDPLADLDLGVVFGCPLPPPEERVQLYANLHNLLSELFLPFPLDLVFLQEQHSVFQANAVTGICIHAQDEQLKSDYEENVMRKAADFRPFLERYLDEYLEEVSS